MMSFKSWLSWQLVSEKLLSARPFHFFDDTLQHDEPDSRVNTTSVFGTMPPNTSSASNYQTTDSSADTNHDAVDTSQSSQSSYVCNDKDPLTKVEALQIMFLRLMNRLRYSPENLLVSQVLYRLQIASLIRSGESDAKRPMNMNNARAVAAEQESAGQPMEFSLKILVLGKTGVGKSATINSIFGTSKATTNAFHCSTNHIEEVVGTIKGIKVTVIDTPGLSASGSCSRRNRKLLFSIRRFIKKSQPDVVLYFERIDVINKGYYDFPLLKMITDVFGSSIWLNTILVMTHSSSSPPEGPDGYPVSYDGFVHHCTSVMKHYIGLAVPNVQLDTPVILVENHPSCRTNNKGEKVLPNGEVWLSQFLLLCLASKVLGDANSILKFQDSFQPATPSGNRVPSLPHLLSSLLQTRSSSSFDDFDDSINDNLDGEEDEYDQLPPIRILTKLQFQKLSKSQKNAYLDELDYRETLYLKKQWKEDLKRQKERMLPDNGIPVSNGDFESDDVQATVQVSDMVIPLSFDSGNPCYRYRAVLGNDSWLVRPVLDPQGWDHDVSFDGINVEASQEVKRNLHASFVGQMNKDKDDFAIQSECTAKSERLSYHAAVDVQTAGKDLVCTIRGDANFRNLKCNTTSAGLSLTKFGNMSLVGAKIEDSITIGRRFKVSLNTGQVRGCGQVAQGGSLQATLQGKDYPVRDDKVTLGTTVLSFDKEMVIGGSLQSDFRVNRTTKMSINGNLNSRRAGKISVKFGTTEHVEIAVVAIVTLVQAIFRRRPSDITTD